MIHLTLVVVLILSMPIEAMYAAAAALLGALLALLVYHLAVVRPRLAQTRQLLGLHDGLIGAGAGGAADRLKSVEDSQTSLRMALERVTARADELESLSRTDLSRIGFVRYDAFDNTGSDLSYALALLNRDGDGVVITSIYSRTDTRTYGKAVKRFIPAANASEEELQAIERARSSSANE